jgi:phosphoglycolate phosphatase-like HAD superfamily hydrolase
VWPSSALAQDSADLAKAAQNPVAAMISLPLQNNTFFGVGPDGDVANVLNIQPVIPITLGRWNVISRTIAPIIYLADLVTGLDEIANDPQGDDGSFGPGDINQTFYFSPAAPGPVIWGIGPSITIPTATDNSLGSEKWSAGPASVTLTMPGNWVVGSLLRQLWSFAGDSDRQDVNQTLMLEGPVQICRDRAPGLRPLAGSPGALRHFHEQLHGAHLDPRHLERRRPGADEDLHEPSAAQAAERRLCRPDHADAIRALRVHPGCARRAGLHPPAAQWQLSFNRGEPASRRRDAVFFIAREEIAMLARLFRRAARLAILVLSIADWRASAADDPLPSWNDGPTKEAIVAFVQAVTEEGGADFVPPEDRIATFDNDGTLWVEHPLYTQAAFALDRVAALAPQHPEWKEQEPFKAVLAGDREAMAAFTEGDWAKIVAATHAGMTSEAFLETVRTWLATAKHPRYGRPYSELIYQPMLEVMEYLRASGFRTYIVTGGGQEFVRVLSEQVYGVPVEQVVGSSIATKFDYRDGKPVLVREPEIFFVDDKVGKPVGINLFIGRRPYAAFGNSTGDREMLEWTGAGVGARLMMLVLHDDAEREYAYGPANGLPDTKVGTFPQELMDEAKQKGWTVVSMQQDWKHVFTFKQP